MGTEDVVATTPVEMPAGGRRGAVPVGSGSDADPATRDGHHLASGGGLSDEEGAERVAQLARIIALMRPAVQADGGDLALIGADVASGVVEVQLQGACSSCAVSSSTLQGGVERILLDRLPWVTEVIGGVDESADPFESGSMGRGGYVPRF
ncbi:MAG: NifU family protein [Acidimicrobiales bacterium]